MIRTLIFDRSGRNPIEIEPAWDHIAWRLNNVGEGRFFVPYTDPKCDPEILGLGKRVLALSDNGLPALGGVIDVPRRRTSTGVLISVYEAAKILGWRRTAKTLNFVSSAPGTIFQSLITLANQVWNTGITPGAIYTGGVGRTETYHLQEILSVVQNLQRLTGHDWEIVPVYASGRLTFTANWASRLGVDRSETVALIEGLNIEEVTLDEQGPIANQVYTPGGGAGGTSWDNRLVGFAQDLDSRNAYDWREYSEVQTGIFDQTTLDASASALLASKKDPSKSFTLKVVDKEPAGFSAYGVGDIVHLEAFLSHPAWAYSGTVRITGREWSNDGSCRLEVAEWLTAS